MKNIYKGLTAFVFVVSVSLPLSASAALKATPLSIIPNPNVPTTSWSFDRSTIDVPIGIDTQAAVPYDDDQILNIYEVANDRLYKDFARSKYPQTDEDKVWAIFHGIAGADIIKKSIGVFLTYKVPGDPVLGAVIEGREYVDTAAPFILAVNTNGSDFKNKTWARDLSITLVHEYAHILTINKDQAYPDLRNEKQCTKAKRFPLGQFGCAYTDSYINEYVQQFWSAPDTKAAAKAASKGSDSFYKKHKGEFTTTYAASSPTEDIAEAFTDFVLRQKPASSALVSDQKILFFYQYPELVKLRNSIRAAIAPYINA